MLKTFQNGADKDNLLSYFGTDRVMQAQAKKMSDAQAQADDEQQQREFAQIKASDEFKKMKRTLRTQHADRTTSPLSDEKIVSMILQRREALQNRMQRESQQQQSEEE